MGVSGLSIFTFCSVFFQTLITVFMAWMTLQCKLQPSFDELQEVTLTKLLYLYEPKACGQIFFYNYTFKVYGDDSITTVQWLTHNKIAHGFRSKAKLGAALHVIWLTFCIGYMTQGHRVCGFYAALVPFTLTGVVICVVDIVNTIFFLTDTPRTSCEDDILKYINVKNASLYRVNKFPKLKTVFMHHPKGEKDTSWISLLFAFFSCRGIVLWVFNYWMIKDNYFQGLDIFRRHQQSRLKELAKLNQA